MNINQLMKQAQEMQKKMSQAQEELALKEFEGKAGGSMVCIKIDGKGSALSAKIDKSLMNGDDQDMLEDLIVAAFNDAKSKLDEYASSSMGGVLGGLPAGLKLPF
jgi:DNA-binding YbaB/EbfC family protein